MACKPYGSVPKTVLALRLLNLPLLTPPHFAGLLALLQHAKSSYLGAAPSAQISLCPDIHLMTFTLFPLGLCTNVTWLRGSPPRPPYNRQQLQHALCLPWFIYFFYIAPSNRLTSLIFIHLFAYLLFLRLNASFFRHCFCPVCWPLYPRHLEHCPAQSRHLANICYETE